MNTITLTQYGGIGARVIVFPARVCYFRAAFTVEGTLLYFGPSDVLHVSESVDEILDAIAAEL